MCTKKSSVLMVGSLAVTTALFLGTAPVLADGDGGQEDGSNVIDEKINDQVTDPDGGTGDASGKKKDPGAYAYGKSYREWSAAWWQWALEIPAYENPILDPDGRFGHIGQAKRGKLGKVWFLAGTTGGPAERSVTVPKKRALFFPVVNASFFNCVGEEYTEEEMREILAEWVGNRYCQLKCTLDGEAITISSSVIVRTQSPAFAFTVPEDFIWAETCEDPLKPPDPGTELYPNVSVGMWVMLPPLEEGEHELYFHGASCDPDTGDPYFETEVTYNLTIED